MIQLLQFREGTFADFFNTYNNLSDVDHKKNIIKFDRMLFVAWMEVEYSAVLQ